MTSLQQYNLSINMYSHTIEYVLSTTTTLSINTLFTQSLSAYNKIPNQQ